MLVVALSAVALAGCGGKDQAADLTAHPWVVTQVLVSGSHQPVLPGSVPAIYFKADGTVVGNATLNVFRGPYTLKGRSIDVGTLAQTSWDGPTEELKQEQVVLDALAATSRYHVGSDGTLQLSDSSKTLLLSLKPAENPTLVGPNWVCTSLVSAKGQLESVVGSSPISAAFAPDGTLVGFGGVNQYSTRYKAAAPQMAIDPQIVSTKMAGPEPLMAQETRYLDTITRTVTYKIEDYQLSLVDKFGIVSAVYIPVAPKN
jgi:heat shock protein HslJ